MRRVLRYLGRALTVIALAVAVVIGAALIFTSTAAFNHLLRNKTVSYLNANYRGKFSIAKVQGSIWSRLKLEGVTADYGGHQVAHIAQISMSYSLVPLLWGALHLRLFISKPQIHLERAPDGNWNLLDAIGDRAPSSSSSSIPLAIIFDEIGVSGGTVQILPSRGSASAYDLTGVEMGGSLKLTASGTRADLRRVEATVSAHGLPTTHVRAILAYQDASQPPTVNIKTVKVTTHDSALSLNGEVRLAQTMVIDGGLVIHKLAAADISRLYPASPLTAALSGSLSLKGPANALHARIALSAGGATLGGNVDADTVSKPQRYSVKLALDHAVIAKLVRIHGAAGLVSATLSAQGAGLDLAATTAHLTVHGEDLAAARYKLGRVDLNAGLAHKLVRAKLVVDAPAGRLNADGTASVSANPTYRLTIAAQKLNIANVQAGAGTATPTDINFNATVDGQGLKPASMSTRITGKVGLSRMGPVRIDRGALDIQIAHGRADIARFDLTAQRATIALKGYAGLTAGAESKVSYRLRTRDLGGLLRIVHRKGGGSLDLAGTLTGPSSALRARGTAIFERPAFAAYSAGRGELRYDVVATGPEAPYGDATVQLSDVKAGIGLRRLATEIRIARGMPRRVALSLSAEDNAGHRNSLATNLTYQPNLIEGQITQLILHVPTGKWLLAAPAAFRRDSRGISLGRMELRSGQREFIAQGTLTNSGQQNFDLTLSRFNLAALEPLMPDRRTIAGTLSVNASVTGTGATPNLNVKTELRQVRVESQPIGDLSSIIRYQEQQTTVNAVLERGANGRLTVTGTIPMTLEWATGFKMKIGTGINLRVKSERLNLAQLGALAPHEVRDFHGLAAIDLELRGTLSHLAPSGSVKISGVKGEILPLGVTVSEMHAALEVTPQQARLTALEAHAGGGSLSGSGAIGLNGYSPSSAGIALHFNNWPAIDTAEYQARLGGNIAADGSLTAPRIHGSLEILKGTIHPNLSFLTESSPLAPDRTITVIPAGANVPLPQPEAGPPPLPPPPPAQPPSTYNAMALDVTVTIHRDTWIRHEYASAELEGRVQVEKQPHGPVRVAGIIRTVRGWIQYQDRRFTLRTGRLEFTGGREIDPSLDFDAQYLITNYTIDILIGGTANKPTFGFRSTPDLSQADILSLLLFGKTTSALSQGQQTALQQQAAQMAAGYAAEKIGRAVASSIGLQGLGFELSGVSASGGSLGFGRYFGSNTYVSASQSLGGTGGVPGKVSVEYNILPWLAVTTSTFSDGSREIDLMITKHY